MYITNGKLKKILLKKTQTENMKVNEVLFTDVFDPKKLSEYILPTRIISQFEQGIYSHHLFHGNQGIGKSSLGKYLISKHPYLYINAAADGVIETIRGKIPTFCEEIPMNFGQYESNIKVVMLDEVGRKASEAFYEGLKGLMDEYSENVRFIMTTNYIQNLPPSLISRFDVTDFGFLNSDERSKIYTGYTKRMSAIIKGVKMEITPDALVSMIDMNFPDFRKPLQVIQKMKVSKVELITIQEFIAASYDMLDLYKLILTGNISAPEKIHAELMGKYANSALDVLTSLNGEFIKYITKKEITYASIIPESIIQIAKYSDMAGRIDPALAMKACVFKIMQIVNSKFSK